MNFSNKSIGSPITVLGLILYLIGVFLWFDRLFLLIGNTLFLIGTGYLTGISGLIFFFMKPSKLKGTICYFIGFFLILVGWSTVGGILQLYGIYQLFKDFIPQILHSVKFIPGIGPILSNSQFYQDLIMKLNKGKKSSYV
ncbi:unnamed protein product [Blepharisma stoltei]|uniref:Protein transport protein GOT1 n=1 Tax=Blepharisma stoltei TaxID=1481888 RepID=A0AAU9IK71_9CILI|nr:unnamed protein product [Blepharisma stoltei]